MIKLIFATLSLIIAAISFIGFYLSAPKYDGPLSKNFDGARFRNQNFRKHGSFFDLVRWLATRKPGLWAKNQQNKSYPPPPSRVENGVRVTFINHSTLLIQTAEVNILTDPIWSQRCSPVSFMGPKRVRPAGIDFDKLPPIDAVLISHNHYDHLDIATLKQLQKIHRPHFFVGLGNKALLDINDIENVKEMDWWQSFSLTSDVQITAVPAQHFSNRGLFDSNATLWAGFVITSPQGKVFFAGDTGFGPHFAQIKEKFSSINIALLPIGAFMPTWFMGHVHMSPAQAVEAAKILGSRHNIGIHFGTFRLADDGENDPLLALQKALKESAQTIDFITLDFGEGRDYL